MMERVRTLAEKLLKQVTDEAGANSLLTTLQMIEAELLHGQANEHGGTHVDKAISVYTPKVFAAPAAFEEQLMQNDEAPAQIKTEKPAQVTAAPEEKLVETLVVDDAEIEAELAEIREHAAERTRLETHIKPQHSFDPLEEIPTLHHQAAAPPPLEKKPEEFKQYMPKDAASEEIKVEGEKPATPVSDSLNDKLKQSRLEVADAFNESPIKDLRKAIGINDRFLFINELFRGDETMYERSIKTINGYAIFPEAEYWIKRELKLKLGWYDDDAVVKQFDQLVKRRFS